jgi:hypothetical protein
MRKNNLFRRIIPSQSPYRHEVKLRRVREILRARPPTPMA